LTINPFPVSVSFSNLTQTFGSPQPVTATPGSDLSALGSPSIAVQFTGLPPYTYLDSATPVGIGSYTVTARFSPADFSPTYNGNTLTIGPAPAVVSPSFNAMGQQQVPAPTKGWINVLSVAWDPNGNLYVADGGDNSSLHGSVWQFNPAAGTLTEVASNLAFLTYTTGLAADGAGNVYYLAEKYVAGLPPQISAYQVIKAVPVPGGYSYSTLASSYQAAWTTLAMDQTTGNLFIGDSQGRVWELTGAGGSSPSGPTVIFNNTLANSDPSYVNGLALDGSGDLFCQTLDLANEMTVYRKFVPSTGGYQSANFAWPVPVDIEQESLAVDGAGDVFSVQSSSDQISELTSGASVLNFFAIPFVNAAAVAASAQGEIAVAGGQFNQNQVWLIQTSSLPTSFGQVNVGAQSAAMPLRFTFRSSQTLTVQAKVFTLGSTGEDFQDAGNDHLPAPGSSVQAGDTATVNVTFKPTATGDRKGAVVLVDGSGNSLATVYLTGTGVGPQISFLPATQSQIPFFTDITDQPAPGGVAFDGAGNVYLADQNPLAAPGAYIRQWSPSAHTMNDWTAANPPLSPNTPKPGGLAVDGAGNVYYSDQANGLVVRLAPNLSATVVADGLVSPRGVAVDGAGDVFVADPTLAPPPYGNGFAIYRISPQGQGYGPSKLLTTIASFGDLGALAADVKGDVYATSLNGTAPDLVQISPEGGQNILFTGLPQSCALAVDGNGFVYLTDVGGNQVLRVDPGNGPMNALPRGQVASGFLASQLDAPTAIAVDAHGNLVVADQGDGQVYFMEMDMANGPNLRFNGVTNGTSVSQSFTVGNVGNGTSLQFPPNAVPIAGVNDPTYNVLSGTSQSQAALEAILGLSVPNSANAPSAPTAIPPGWNANQTFTLTFAPPLTGAANSYTGTATFTDNNLNAASAQQVVTIYATPATSNKAVPPPSTPVADVTLGSLTQAYTGDPLPVIPTLQPALGSPALPSGFQSTYIQVTYAAQPAQYDGNPDPNLPATTTPPTAVGVYWVQVNLLPGSNWTLAGTTGAKYVITAPQPKPAKVTAYHRSLAYTGAPVTPQQIGAVTNPPGLALVYSFTDPLAGNQAIPAPTQPRSQPYNYTATVADPLYQGQASGQLTISKAPVTVALSNLSNGVATALGSGTTRLKLGSVNVQGSVPGAPTIQVTVTYFHNGQALTGPPTAAGVYQVQGVVNSPLYGGVAIKYVDVTAGP
jgi:hypothetical protein